MKLAARIDANQPDLVAFFRAHGCEVESLAAVGKGVPDLLIAWGHKLALVEIKTEAGKLTPDQVKFHDRFPVVVVRNEKGAADVVGWLKS